MDEPDISDHTVAEIQLIKLDRYHSFVNEQVAAQSKWLTASLLAINGAGGLATLEVIKAGHTAFLSGSMFLAGLTAALLSGTALQEVYNRSSGLYDEAFGYWLAVKHGQSRIESEESDRSDRAGKINRWNFLPPLIGWISGLLFLCGSITLAVQSSPSVA
ncbi:MAG: hypothetical protein ABR588_10660 [Sphingomicrobium sp.]|nr:hypothetical protein [Sphingomonadales bacterium]